ncbi:D-glycero-beta-D-manno-heptose 1,7-bisphosphate 7-phosphatase [Aquicella lusitana]|uniref:D,D-heptose 1,7-bisphosphate phosphatase n=1 Tax=Aquicella lusitana TaxID=254246 RepID=A0A370G6A7_9COXI|nr:D-glycero-beta-D-manno-heptose 1,7-bisphosphate 7-phosphatase [Aquicella lusitana]RDI38379.1 D-alpha,beta-D-heptose 1,7-bisphosphate phosphatase [Aquicella lusitana]VVC72392.1 D-glycero-beta-D-manno-heptose-1,7-bisphosphate 7-phosphatase [Aquicella lusitana]
MSYVILDRDGVINYDSEEYIKTPDEWIPIPGSLSAIAQLNRAGFKVVVATNQSGVARGYYDIDILDDIHEKFLRELAAHGGYVEEIFFCPHHPDEQCPCRKPKPGLLYQIQEKYLVNLTETFFIGDSFVDVQAAHSAGCKPLLVLTGKGEQSLEKYPELLAVPHFSNLASAVEYVIARQKP